MENIFIFRIKSMERWCSGTSRTNNLQERVLRSWKLLDTVIADVVDKYNNRQESESINAKFFPDLADPSIQGDVQN